MSCSITIVVLPRKALFSRSAVRAVSARVIPAVGSSSRIRSGSFSMTTPISSHCFSPCDRSPARSCRRSASCSTSSTSSARSSCRRRPRLQIRPPMPSRPAAPVSRFSSTVRSSKIEGAWNLRLTPSRAMRCTCLPPISWPCSRMRPPSGLIAPVIMLNSVVLPVPFGPMMQRSSPAATSRSRPSKTRSPPKLLVRRSIFSMRRPQIRMNGRCRCIQGLRSRPTRPPGQNSTTVMKKSPTISSQSTTSASDSSVCR